MINTNPLLKLTQQDQSIWLDFIERGMLNDGTLKRLILEDGISGMTSNPAIFQKAIAGSDVYSHSIKEMAERGADTAGIYEHLVISDVSQAADILRTVFDDSQGLDGYVSLEVSPLIAHDTESTISEARRLWKALARPNIMIKVPGTIEGLSAFRQLTRDGININVTLLFSVNRYIDVIHTYMDGLEQRQKDGNPLGHVASVASFFMSRIDVKIDKLLDNIIAADDEPNASIAREVRGHAAIADAGMAYRSYTDLFSSDRWQKLAAEGARKQRLLWASTSAKDPDYSDIKYVESLIGADTVNTLPMKTIDAYRDHGDPMPRIQMAMETAPGILERITGLGISLDKADEELEQEGLVKFVQPYEKLLEMIADSAKVQ